MARTQPSKHVRVLAISPSYDGFGYAILDGDVLADWGVKIAKGDRNVQSLAKIKPLVADYQPDIMALEDYTSPCFRRASRIRVLIEQIREFGLSDGLDVTLIARSRINKTFSGSERGSKDSLASVVVKRFPDELGFKLPPKRRPWSSEHYQMCVFEAVALGLMVWK